MCGGFTVAYSIKKAALEYGFDEPDFDFVPRNNARPGQNLPVVLSEKKSKIQLVHWGLKPYWLEKTGKKNELINVRLDSFEKPAFINDFASRRCVIICDGFFEWKKEGSVKQPYVFRMKDERPFLLAGVWQQHKDFGVGFAVITTNPNELVDEIHDRMPLIIDKDNLRHWLDGNLKIRLLLNSAGYAAEQMCKQKVATKINSPIYEGELH
ncbi:SOS response-associated peptidase [Candidatus Peregrinibacteria bacterium]|nr:SOS response-associated peptidase [Candidatus Peregrinibacteria bacterium]